MFRVVIVFICLGLLLVGCRSSDDEGLEGQIEKVETNHFVVDCSDEANKGKKGAIDAVGYGCNVEYTHQTIFRDESGKALKIDDFSSGSIVNVVFEKPVNIRESIAKKKPFVVTAKEIVLLTNEDNH
ncbi:hypothetical protein [Paenibacillus montanisoli]|uniref:Uncharacterized protein n=1 Tax=Paenibacillus montanisoli TaxID=2081970 RepID=A0A328U2T9_9BACL|nr:hypothetical protein [Paenibacillus montanisoli]RAP76093.1 hypothetical protein DL346_11770 [Paenibacillus montanisoli]